MLLNTLPTALYPTLKTTDKVQTALQLMDDFDVQHLPLLSENNYLGLLAKEDAIDADPQAALQTLQDALITAPPIKKDEHLTAAIQFLVKNNCTLVPVVDMHKEWCFGMSIHQLLIATATYLDTSGKGGIIMLEVNEKDYLFSEINRLVETNDAHIVHLSTVLNKETGKISITLKLNKPAVSDIVASLQRYDYAITFFTGEEEYNNTLIDNYNHLLAYLNV